MNLTDRRRAELARLHAGDRIATVRVARERARRRLARLHPEEFEALVAQEMERPGEWRRP